MTKGSTSFEPVAVASSGEMRLRERIEFSSVTIPGQGPLLAYLNNTSAWHGLPSIGQSQSGRDREVLDHRPVVSNSGRLCPRERACQQISLVKCRRRGAIRHTRLADLVRIPKLGAPIHYPHAVGLLPGLWCAALCGRLSSW